MPKISSILTKSLSSLPARLALILALLAALALAPGAPLAYADTTRTIDVDPIADDDPDAGCTLREAISLANAGAGAGTTLGCTIAESGWGIPTIYDINLPAYTYLLTGAAGENDNVSGDLDIKADVNIHGAGAGSTVLDANHIDRVFHINPEGIAEDFAVSLSDMTIQHGYDWADYGGGINASRGTLTVARTTFLRNEAVIYGYGGGLYLDSTHATLTLTDVTFLQNQSSYTGGGLYNSAGTVTIAHSTFLSNTSDYGGAICNSSGVMTIDHSFLSGNRAETRGGGIVSEGGLPLTMTNSTLADNWSGEDGGGIHNRGALDISNSTLSGNRAGEHGGGLCIHAGAVNLNNVTLTENSADANNTHTRNGGGIYRLGGTVKLRNTLVAGNHDLSQPGDQHPDCSGEIMSLDYNLIGDRTGCVVTVQAHDQFGGDGNPVIDARLGPLADNGGATPTCALLTYSPALEDGSCTDSSGNPVLTDQRDLVRPGGYFCDVGAYEGRAELSLAKSVTPESDVAYHGTVTYTLVLYNGGVLGAQNISLADTLPPEVDFGGWAPGGQPAGASVVDDQLTWTGNLWISKTVTFTFTAQHVGGYGDVVVNTAGYDHDSGSGSDEATFHVEPEAFYVFLPLVVRNTP